MSFTKAHSSTIRPAPFSDHHLVAVTVSLRAEGPGPAYWHFNNSLLEDESFVMSFREFWLAWREQWRAFPSVRRWWDLGKVRAKLFCRNYTRGTSRRRNAAIEQLEREVLELERRLAASPGDPSLCGACREKREELRALEDHRARGAFVRSRIRLLREMDRGSRFFYALEKTRGAKKHVTCLLAEDGTPLTDPEEMCGRARDFYANLFSPDPTDPGACGGALGGTPHDERCSPCCRRRGDLRDLRNWRPLSLLSTDYKIVAKAISLRLGSVMADVIHPDQTYTVPGRSIFDNLFLVRDLLELGRRDGLSFALLSLDQEKAFDRVDHGYLLSTLRAFGFGPQFVSFLRVLYASAECLVRLNWTLTEPVSFGRGVRQGCPLSGQLYALAIEPFLCLLRRRLTGLVLREPELRLVLSAYADDVLLVVQDPGDLARVEACQTIFSAASSARVNWVKSSGLAVGGWRQVPVLSFLREGGYSVIFLQETHTDLTVEDSWWLEWGDRVYFSHFTIRQAGVATLFSPDLRPKVLGVAKAMLGCLLHLWVHIEGLMVNFVNVYAPTSGPERLQFYQQASTFLGTLGSHECLVLGGDFNTILEERDRSGTEQSPAAMDTLREIVEHHSLVDIWRDHHPDDTSTFTFVWEEAHQSSHSRLDRIYLSCFHLSRAHSSSIRLASFSDHHLATVTATLCAERPGPASWHFNNSLLEDEGFLTSFREFWLAWRGQRRAFPSVRGWWDLGKVRALLFCRDYTWDNSRRRNAVIEQLEREVLELERRLAASPGDPSLCGACREKREELRALEDHRARGAFVRSRIRLLQEMDRGSRFFYALEKTRGGQETRHLPPSGRRHPPHGSGRRCVGGPVTSTQIFSPRIRPILALAGCSGRSSLRSAWATETG
ncbi:unnamed protein product [Caretta caretta]